MFFSVANFVARYLCCCLHYNCDHCAFSTRSYTKFYQHLESHLDEADELMDSGTLYFDADPTRE